MIRAKAARMTDEQLGAELRRIDQGIRVSPDARSVRRWERRRHLIDAEVTVRQTAQSQLSTH